MPVKDASIAAITLKEDESLHDARNAMLSYGIDRVVIVTEDYQPIGIITEKDAMQLTYGYIPQQRRLDDIKLCDVMSTDLVAIYEEDNLGSCARLMLDSGISSVIVTDNKHVLKGICTKTTITDLCAKNYYHTDRYPIVYFMSSKVLTVKPDDNLDRVLSVMVNNNITRVVVVAKEGEGEDCRLVGIITKHDLLPLSSLVDPYFNRFSKIDISQDFGYMLTGAPIPLGIKAIFRARDIMKQDPITITMYSNLACAAQIMMKNRIGCLPVLATADSQNNDKYDNNNNNLVGIITKTDVTTAMSYILPGGDMKH
jgi:CBS domain-containing protein